jgi:YbbR domain-containing protein
MLRQNLGYKILALALAIFLWFYVTIQQRNVKAFTVPVELRNLSSAYVASTSPAHVRLVLRGRPDAVESPSPAPQAYVDLKRLQAGERLVEVSYIIPLDLRLVRIEPRQVQLTVRPIIHRTMKVEANIVGTVPPGYVLGQPEITPAAVTISGVRDAVTRVSHVVVNVDASYARPDTPQTNALRPVDDAGEVVQGVQLSRAEARVIIPVRRVLSYETVPVALRSDGAPAPGHRVAGVSVRPPLVTIAGDAERLREVSHVNTATVNLDNATTDIHRVVPLALPDGITTVSESRVTVTINIEPQE